MQPCILLVPSSHCCNRDETIEGLSASALELDFVFNVLLSRYLQGVLI